MATDRLPEERARGMTIDLGFAYWQPDAGPTIGFVDVPGHERHVRNMLAGASGIDFALLVVAADDGVMPQTIEHVQILDLLGIARGVVAITKCDRCPQQRIGDVRQQVEALLARTTLAGAPMFEVSATTGTGVPALATALSTANRVENKRAAHERYFRLAIDRAFSVSGAGTVVTGTVRDGTIEIGDRVVLSPKGLETRIRGLQSAGQLRARVEAGERCAINLTGVEVAQIHRGDWLLVSRQRRHSGTSAGIETGVVCSRQRGHHATRARSSNLRRRRRPLRFARSFRPFADGGGMVIDPLAPTERRKQHGRAAVSAALQLIEPPAVSAALLAIAGYEVNTPEFERRFNVTPSTAQALYTSTEAALLGSLAVSAERIADVTHEIVESLKTFHREHPDARGMSPRDLKASLTTPISTDAFLVIQKELADKRVIESSGAVVRLPGRTVGFSAADDERWHRLQRLVHTRGDLVFSPSELAAGAKISEPAVNAMLYRRRSSGDVWRIDDDRFMLRDHLAALAARAAALAKEVGGKGFTAAQYRDATGIGRNQVIRILEFFDGIGVTRRDGDCRSVMPDYCLIVGTAAPYLHSLDKPVRSTAP